MSRFAIALLIPLISGCVMPGDIASLRDSQARYAEGVTKTLEGLEDRSITKDQARAEIQDAQEDYDREVEDRVEIVAKRTEEAMALVSALKDGGLSGLAGSLGGQAGITAVGMGILAAMRNRTRRRDLELVEAKTKASV